MTELRTSIVTLDLQYLSNFDTDETRDSFNQEFDKFYNITRWVYTSELLISKMADWVDPNDRASQVINRYVNEEVNWRDDDVGRQILVPSKYDMIIDPVEGPDIVLKGGGSFLNSVPFILLETRIDGEPKSPGRNFQGYLYKIHLIGCTYNGPGITTKQQPYVTLFPAPGIEQGEASEYYSDSKSILKLKYMDKNEAGVIGHSTDYRCKEVESLFDYIRSIDKVDINLEMLQNKLYDDYEMPVFNKQEHMKKRLVTKLFNKL